MRSYYLNRWRHIMKGPFAAQACDCRLLLPKSLTDEALFGRPGDGSNIDKSVVPQRVEHLIDGCTRLRIDCGPSRCRRNRRSPAADDLHAADHDAGPAKHSEIPCARAKIRPDTGRFHINADPVEWRDEAPAPARICCQRVLVSQPRIGWRGPDDVTSAESGRRRRGGNRSVLNRAADNDIERLQRLIMEEFLLGPTRNSSLCLSCTESA